MREMRSALIPIVTLALLASCGESSNDTTPPAPTPDPGPADAAPNVVVSLKPGEVADLAVTDGTAGIALTTGGGDEKYVVILASTKLDASGASSSWSIATDAVPDGVTSSLATGCALHADEWAMANVAVETPPSGTAVAQGTKKTIHMQKAAGEVEDIDVEAIAIGKSAVVWADVTVAHPATLDSTFVSQFLGDFDDLILPRERTVFGVESDLDKDGHIALVFTPLTKDTAIAFFSGCDLASFPGCPTTNDGEYLYLTPPNAIDPPYNTPNAIKEILAHELSHLVHFNRKVLRNQQTSWPDSQYMVEGTGALAQDVIGPQAGNLYVTMAGLQGISQFSLGDVVVDGTPYDQSRDGVMRGGSYLFARWLYDRAGGDTAKADGTIQGKGGPAFLRAVLDTRDSVAKALPTVTKSTLADIALDFYTTLAMSNRDEAGGVVPANPCFSYLPIETDPVTMKQRGADLFVSFHGQQMTGPEVTDKTSGKLLAGGVTYVNVAPAAGGTELDLSVTVDAKTLPRVRVGRIR